jgi:hypothetical protein
MIKPKISKLVLRIAQIKNVFRFSEEYSVTDVKNSHLVYVKDPKSTLPFLS